MIRAFSIQINGQTLLSDFFHSGKLYSGKWYVIKLAARKHIYHYAMQKKRFSHARQLQNLLFACCNARFARFANMTLERKTHLPPTLPNILIRKFGSLFINKMIQEKHFITYNKERGTVACKVLSPLLYPIYVKNITDG